MFLDELDRAMDRIGQNPEQFPSHDFGTRRMVLRRFPFAIVFRKAAAGVEIVAIALRSAPSGLLVRAPRISQARLSGPIVNALDRYWRPLVSDPGACAG